MQLIKTAQNSMPLSLYVMFTQKFVQSYSRLPQYDEYVKQRDDYINSRQYDNSSSLAQILEQKKKPCEVCDDYFAFKKTGQYDSFMYGTFTNKKHADDQIALDGITYIPLSNTGQTVVNDKLADAQWKQALTTEELYYQIELFNMLEGYNINQEQFSLQLVLVQNPSITFKPAFEYQHAVYTRMLQVTRYPYQLDSTGTPSWLAICYSIQPMTKGNIYIKCKDLDRFAQLTQSYNYQFNQCGFLSLNDTIGGVYGGIEKDLGISRQTQYDYLVAQLSSTDTDTMKQVQASDTKQKLTDIIKYLDSTFLGQAGNVQYGEGTIPLQYTEYGNLRASCVDQLVMFLWYICPSDRIIVPLFMLTGKPFTREPDRFMYMWDVDSQKKTVLPYVEYAASSIHNVSLADVRIILSKRR